MTSSDPAAVVLFTKARTWLMCQAERTLKASDPHTQSLLQLVIGIHLCNTVVTVHAVRKEWHALLGSVEQRLQEEARIPGFDPFRYDAKLLLLGIGILIANGFRVVAMVN